MYRYVELVLEGNVDNAAKFPLFVSQDGAHLGVKHFVQGKLRHEVRLLTS